MSNLRDKIKAAGRKLHRFNVPNWGFDVCIRAWSAAELADHADYCRDKGESAGMELLARIAAMSLCDESGQLLFRHDDSESLSLLGDKDFSSLRLIADEILKLNGLSEGQSDSFRRPDQAQ